MSCKESHELENTTTTKDENNVSIELAQKFGSAFSDEKNFWKNLSNSTKKEKSARLSFSKKTIKEILTYKRREDNFFYVINYNEGGFLLLSCDKRFFPIIGASDDGSFKNDDKFFSPSMKGYLENLSEQMLVSRKKSKPEPEVQKSWDSLPYPGDGGGGSDEGWQAFTFGPFISTTWGQDEGYNSSCPDASNGPCGKAYTGCVATAMCQIMKYWNYPNNYNWGSMPSGLSNSCQPESDLSHLMKDAGSSVSMTWDGQASSAYTSDVPSALCNYFHYSTASYQSLNYGSLVNELYGSHPVIIRGDGSGGHAWVCDGYSYYKNPNGDIYGTTFHMNWGWEGSNNGYYSIGNFNPGGQNFNNDNHMVTNIRP